MPSLASVIICTHNPRTDYLNRVLASLKEQTLPLDQWEFLLIDNASKQPLSAVCDLSWHPQARIVVEPELGLTHARLRGIDEASGELLIFVDDDNILAQDYIAAALEIAHQYPSIGAFGGSIRGEFETPPQPWALPYLERLAVSEIQKDSWSNFTNGWNQSVPYGAGLCVRRSVAHDYRAKSAGSGKRKALGRVGTGTGSAEDTDLCYCAVDLGMGMGRFARLKITHLISSKRLSEDYIVRLSAGIKASGLVLASLRPSTAAPAAADRGYRFSWLRSKAMFCINFITASPIERKIANAERAGRRAGQRFLKDSASDKFLLQH